MIYCAIISTVSLVTIAVCAVLRAVQDYHRYKAQRNAYKPATRDEQAMLGKADGWMKLG